MTLLSGASLTSARECVSGPVYAATNCYSQLSFFYQCFMTKELLISLLNVKYF